jgi:GntR family transcriptional regulator, carbon starvation induced regulator
MERRAKKTSAAGPRFPRDSAQGNGNRGAAHRPRGARHAAVVSHRAARLPVAEVPLAAVPSVGIPPAPVRTPSRTLTTDLFEQIRSDILHNRLEPGSRLLFRDMRERYRSGLSPLREALMRLVSEGLVLLEDHKGFRVAPVSREEMIDIANTLLELEAIAIRMAVDKGDDRWEAQIVARYHELSKREMFATDGTLDTEWEARNVAFHEALYEACGSPSLKLVCHLLYERHSRYRRLRTRQGDPSRNVAKEHEGLMRATIGRNADAAIALLRKHRSATMADVTARWPVRGDTHPQ